MFFATLKLWSRSCWARQTPEKSSAETITKPLMARESLDMFIFISVKCRVSLLNMFIERISHSACKVTKSREQNKRNVFLFYAETQNSSFARLASPRSSPSRWQSYGKTREEQNKLFVFYSEWSMFAIIKMAKAHYYNMKHSFFSPFFILFEVTSKKTAKKFARFQKTFYLCTRIQNKCIIASVAQLVRAPDC